MSFWQEQADGIPQNVTTLSISWLNGRVWAKGIHRGTVTGTWETTLPADGEPDFAKLIQEAVKQTHYDGTTVSLLLANPNLAQNLVEVPPVTGSGLHKIIQREAQQQKLFQGEAAWTFQPALTVKELPRVILQLLPKTLLDRLVQDGLDNGLYLNAVVPVSAVLHGQMARLGLKEGEVALLAAETGGTTTVVVAQADGQLLLVRTLLGNWNENAERLALDLKRTLSFITQQYELNVNGGVWLFGPGAEQQAPVLQRLLDLPVAASPVAAAPDYWTDEAAKLRPAGCPNFIGLDLQKAPQRKIFARVIAVNTALLVLGSLTVAVMLHVLAQQAVTNTEFLRKRANQLQEQRQELTQRNSEYDGKRQIVQSILEDRQPPVPAWFLGYLGEALPDELVLTNLQVAWATNVWQVSLAGQLQPDNAPTNLPHAVGVLADRLAKGPFHLVIAQRSDRPEPGATNAPPLPHFGNKGAAKGPSEIRFSISGVMQ